MKEWFDRQHTNTSLLYWDRFRQGWRRHPLCRKRAGYLRKVLESIPLCTFVSLAALQWRRGLSRPHPGGSRVQQIEAITESPQQHCCSQDLLGVVPASTNDALSTARLALAKGGEGELQEGGPARALLYLFLTCIGLLNKVVTPRHNHQTGLMHIKPPNEVVWFRIRFNLHSPNRFMCRSNESGFTPRLYLWMCINPHSFC